VLCFRLVRTQDVGFEADTEKYAGGIFRMRPALEEIRAGTTKWSRGLGEEESLRVRHENNTPFLGVLFSLLKMVGFERERS